MINQTFWYVFKKLKCPFRSDGLAGAPSACFRQKKNKSLAGKRGLAEAFYSRCPDALAHGSIGASGSSLNLILIKSSRINWRAVIKVEFKNSFFYCAMRLRAVRLYRCWIMCDTCGLLLFLWSTYYDCIFVMCGVKGCFSYWLIIRT